MQSWTFAAVLLLQCLIPLVMGDGQQYMDISSYAKVGTVSFKGSKLRVYEMDGVQVAEPRVSFGMKCNILRYNRLYLKYQLTIPIDIDVNTLRSPKGTSKSVGRVTLTGLRVKPNKALNSKDSKLTVMTRMTKSKEAQLIFFCSTFSRCRQLKEDVESNPNELRRAVKFIPVGRVGEHTVRFGAIRSANAPKVANCNRGRWIVFQRRVDGSLSFAQNWNSYVKGFGNPKSNYWMGLDRLFAMTVTSTKNGYAVTSRCRLRIKARDFKGKSYWGEYKLFEVLGPQQNYRLRVGQEVRGSQLVNFVTMHNGMQFSTYDKDHDKHRPTSCSKLFGYGGWWYSECHSVNLNGAYTTDRKITNNPTYASAVIHGKGHLVMKHTLMKFMCN